MLAILLITLLCFFLGIALSLCAQFLSHNDDALVEQINSILPQTQCAQCGYPGCKPYAKAIAAGDAQIDQCPPGGEQTLKSLAQLLDRPITKLNPEFGDTKPPMVALIREAECIGCTLCINACPVDAIVGAARYMHTVIHNECTGCELCIPPCPVDCIDLIPVRERQ